jgi:hypothetical protein
MPTSSEVSAPNPQQLRDGIAEHGWLCVHIMAEQGEAPYSFTVGLFRTYSHPELIIFGLAPEVAHAMLSRAVENIQQGQLLGHGPCSGLIDGVNCETRWVPIEQYQRYVALCRQYYAGDRFPLLEIVRAGRRA